VKGVLQIEEHIFHIHSFQSCIHYWP